MISKIGGKYDFILSDKSLLFIMQMWLPFILQILADFPQLQPYVDNVVIQRKLQKHMLGNLKARINCDQKR